MSTFIDDMWEAIWSGWTPIGMLVLFFLGLSMARKFSELGVSTPTVILAYILGMVAVPLSLPFFASMMKK